MITVSIDEASPVPPFEQIRAQITASIAVGAVPPGARLPTVRQLASDLALAPNTVARAYRALEEAGYIEAHGRRGTTVAVRRPGPEHPQALLQAASEYLATAKQLGASLDEAVWALRALIG